jgi:O-antigen/teichoic acid export membrane protein
MPKESEESMKIFESISRKTVLFLLNSFILAFIGLISWYFIANNMPIEFVGIKDVAFATCGLALIFSDLGFGAAHIKRVSEKQDLGECIGAFMIIRIAVTIFCIFLLVGAIFGWKYILGYGFETKDHEYMIYLLIGYVIAMSLSIISTQTLAALMETAKQQIVLLLASVVQVIVTIIVVIYTNDLYLFGFTWVIGALVNVTAAMFFLSRYPIKLPKLNLFKSYFTFALPVFVYTIIGKIPVHLDKIMIQFFWSAKNVALYGGGQKFSFFLLQIPIGLGLLLFPTISSLDAQGMIERIKGVVNYAERFITLIIAPVCILMFILAKPIVTIMGNIQYEYSYQVLQPLAIWGFIVAINTPYARLMLGTSRQYVILIMTIAGVGLHITLNLIFIPDSILGIELLGFGAKGAAYATLLAGCGQFLILRFFAYKHFKMFINPKIFKLLLCGMIMGGVVFSITLWIPITRFVYLFLAGMIGMELYLILLFLFKGIKKEEIKLFEQILNPVLMLKYVRDEVRGKEE